MTSPTSMVFAAFIYSMFQSLNYTSTEEEVNRGIKTNLGSKLMYLLGVTLFIYRFHKQPWNVTTHPLRLLFDALAAILVFEVLYSFLWLKIEHFFIETAPSALNYVLELLDTDTQVPQWLFIIPLYIISVVFLIFAYNSDIYLDRWLEPDAVLDEMEVARNEPVPELFQISSRNSMLNFRGGFGEPISQWMSAFPTHSSVENFVGGFQQEPTNRWAGFPVQTPFSHNMAPTQGPLDLSAGRREPANRWDVPVQSSPDFFPISQMAALNVGEPMRGRVVPQSDLQSAVSSRSRGRGRGTHTLAISPLRRSSRIRDRSTPRG